MLLPALARHADVTLWTDRPTWDADCEAHAEVRTYDADAPPWADLSRADMTLYHVGNEPKLHDGILRVSHRQPGVVVLHDFSLFHLIAIVSQQRDESAALFAAMERWYGR